MVPDGAPPSRRLPECVRSGMDFAQKGPIMSKDPKNKTNVKKKGKTLKEKQTAKREKRETQNGHPSNIPAK
jgi:hypothetical protein